MPRKPTEMVQVNLRIRESLRRRLEHEALKANRSLNAEMIRRIETAFENEDLAPQIKVLNATLEGMVARQARQGRVLAGWLANELRSRGLDDKNTSELEALIRAYFGKGEQP